MLPVAAVSVGVVDDNVLLDLCYEEDVRAATDMNVAMDNAGGFIEIQGTGEARSFSRKETEEMLDVASKGIEQLLKAQTQFLNM